LKLNFDKVKEKPRDLRRSERVAGALRTHPTHEFCYYCLRDLTVSEITIGDRQVKNWKLVTGHWEAVNSTESENWQQAKT